MPRHVSFAASAIKDLEEIRAWYIDQQVPDVGERLVRDVVNEAEGLAEFPQKGRIVPEFASPHLRELILPPFRVVYRLNANAVRIVRVWRSERLLKLP